jgi:hypothetical protein
MEQELIDFLVSHKTLGHKHMNAPETWIFQTKDLPEKFHSICRSGHVVLKEDVLNHLAVPTKWLVYL